MKILVIDDQHSNLDFFQDVLTSDFKVFTFDCPKTALSNVSEINPDLILLDCYMPLMDGHEVLKKLKSNFPLLPVIMISGYRIEENLIRAMDALIDDFVFKPVMVDELIARIKNKINKSRKYLRKSIINYESDTIQFDDLLEIVTINEKIYQLKGKEYRLLKYLVSRENELVTREDIFFNIWGDVCVSQATLDTHICQIRRKIDEHGEKIITRKNTGFIFSKELLLS